MKAKTEAVAEGTATEQQWTPVQRVVFPGESDTSLWPLYVDWGVAPSSAALSASQGDQNLLTLRQFEMPRGVDATRTSLLIPARERLSLATYFNAFPASYWQRWTDVRNIRLTLKLSKRAVVEVMRSSARGTFTPVATRAGSGELSFDIPLNRFGDGGWIWPEITALKEDVELEWGTWSVPAREGDRHANVTVGITTYNLPEDCLTQAERFQAEPEVLDHIAEILIVDQGNKNVKDCERYPRLQEELGSKLRVIEQANLGGSGGFSRGMYEMLKNPDSDYVLLLDDDAVIEPEGLLRALAFAEHTLTPTIVGGHMFNANERTILHSMGETIDAHKFWWGAVNPELATVDLAQRTIRNDPRLNRRIDVAYNGWWMCLIPKPVVAEIGLSLPFFIKWDDSEYGLRAAEHGFPTVSLPGAAVWHVPWTEKDDGLDWQAYFHQRNRWVAALLHSPYPRGASFPKTSLASDVRALLSLQYYSADLRRQGLKDVLLGPGHLHPSMHTRAAEARAKAKEYTDARLMTEAADFPAVHRKKPAPVGTKPDSRAQFISKAIAGITKQFLPEGEHREDRVEDVLSSTDARWWRLANLNSALVSNAEGSGAWRYQRDAKHYRRALAESIALHAELIRRWASLSREYREALPELVSVQAWEKTFGLK